VGLDLYVKLLEQTILELKGEAPPDQARATLNLKLDLRIPEEYVPEVHQRMSLYKRASQVRSPAEIQALRDEVRDRYGALPPQVDALLGYAGLRLRSEALGIVQADLAGGSLHLRFAPTTPLAPETLVPVVRRLPGASLSPQGVLRVPLPPGSAAPLALASVLRALEGVGAASSL
jgi:transcription-repair coupling factor (superfamily II helicase)